MTTLSIILLTLLMVSLGAMTYFIIKFIKNNKENKTLKSNVESKPKEKPKLIDKDELEFQKEVEREVKEAKKQQLYQRKKKIVALITDNDKEIISFKKFIYQDGNTYFFRVLKWSHNDYHCLKCYKKVDGEYQQIGEEELLRVDFTTKMVKSTIDKVLKSLTHVFDWEDWDGTVGEIPDHIKREARLKYLLDKNKNDTKESETNS